MREEALLGLAVVGLLILVVVAVVAIPILIRVFGEAVGRNENRPGGEGDENAGRDRDGRSGSGRE